MTDDEDDPLADPSGEAFDDDGGITEDEAAGDPAEAPEDAQADAPAAEGGQPMEAPKLSSSKLPWVKWVGVDLHITFDVETTGTR